MKKTKFITSKKECLANIKKSGLVTSCCGKPLKPIKTVDNAGRPTYWPGCPEHGYFDYGVKKREFEIAIKMVDERGFWACHHDQKPDKDKEPGAFDYWRITQIKGTVSIVQDIIHYLIT